MAQPDVYSQRLFNRCFMPVYVKSFFIVVLASLLFFFPQSAYAVDVQLAWDANTESDLAGYRVYSRVEGASYDYEQAEWEGTDTTCIITGLEYDITYYFVARAFDTSDNESTNSNEISYQAHQEQAPTAEAGPNQTVGEGYLVTLDGSNSSDPDGTIVSYGWTQTGGTTVTLSDAAASQPSFTAPDVGAGGESLTFSLTVTDDDGLQSSDTCIVNISWVNLTPTANAGPDQTVNENVSVTLDGTNSTDPDDGIASYLWSQTAGTAVSLSAPASSTLVFTAPAVGSGGEALTFELTVSDGGGLSDSDTVIINVSNVNQAPTAAAGANQTVGEGDAVTLDGTNSTDPDGTVVSYSWSQTGGTAVTLSDAAVSQPAFTAPDVGPDGESLTFALTVTDDGGLQSSDTCIVNISWVNLTPTASAGPDQTVNENAWVTLDGTNSTDPDDGIVSYLWNQTAGTTVSLSAPASSAPLFASPLVGADGEALTFELTVSDGGGLSDTDTVIINVSNVNQAPAAAAGADQTVGEGDSVSLDGSDSADPDGTIVSYGWTQTGGTAVTLSDAAASQPAFPAPDVGPDGEALTFALAVTDDGGLQSSDVCIVDVSYVDTTPPASPGGFNVASVD